MLGIVTTTILLLAGIAPLLVKFWATIQSLGVALNTTTGTGSTVTVWQVIGIAGSIIGVMGSVVAVLYRGKELLANQLIEELRQQVKEEKEERRTDLAWFITVMDGRAEDQGRRNDEAENR